MLDLGRLRKRGEQRRSERRLEIALRETGEAVLERDRLALLGQLEPARRLPLWLREELQSLRFSREGRAVRAEVVCAAQTTRRRPDPIRVEVFAAPRNGGGL